MKSLRRNSSITGLKIVNQADSLVLEVYDVIGAGYWGDGITAQSVSDALKNSRGPVSLRINSPGGDAFEGVAIYNLLRQSGRQVNVRVDGLAASAAATVAMAGDKREMGKGTMLMIHPAMVIAAGDAEDLRSAADTLDSVTASMAEIYASRSGNDTKKVIDWMNAETWMTPQECIDSGFATGMTEDQADMNAVAAAFDLSVFKHAPEALIVNPEVSIPDKPTAESESDFMMDIRRKRIALARNA
jgi:ATP-dependent protease ClpP protease subunit